MSSSRRDFIIGCTVLAGLGAAKAAREGVFDDTSQHTQSPTEPPTPTPTEYEGLPLVDPDTFQRPQTQTETPTSANPPTTLVSLDHRPTRPSELAVTVEIVVSPGIETLSLTHRGITRVTSVSGMHPRSSTSHRWDGESAVCRMEMVLDVSGEVNDSFGGLDYAGTPTWIFAPIPYLGLSWTDGTESGFTGLTNIPVDLVRDRTRDHVTLLLSSGGYIGETSLYLGKFEEYSHQGTFQTVTLVVPSHASPDASPSEIFESLEFASRTLQVGDRPKDVVVFVTTDPIRGGGLKMSDWNPEREEAWVHETASVDSPGSSWLHEYVHTRQTLSLDEDMEWFREASAEYYAARLWWEKDRAEADTAAEQLGVWDNGVRVVRHLDPDAAYASTVLADERRWNGPRTPYRKGGYVLLALDTLIEDRTDGRASLEDVFRRMNGADESVDVNRFFDIVEDVSGGSWAMLQVWPALYITGDEVPPLSGWWRKVEEYVDEHPFGATSTLRTVG